MSGRSLVQRVTDAIRYHSDWLPFRFSDEDKIMYKDQRDREKGMKDARNKLISEANQCISVLPKDYDKALEIFESLNDKQGIRKVAEQAFESLKQGRLREDAFSGFASASDRAYVLLDDIEGRKKLADFLSVHDHYESAEKIYAEIRDYEGLIQNTEFMVRDRIKSFQEEKSHKYLSDDEINRLEGNLGRITTILYGHDQDKVSEVNGGIAYVLAKQIRHKQFTKSQNLATICKYLSLADSFYASAGNDEKRKVVAEYFLALGMYEPAADIYMSIKSNTDKNEFGIRLINAYIEDDGSPCLQLARQLFEETGYSKGLGQIDFLKAKKKG